MAKSNYEEPEETLVADEESTAPQAEVIPEANIFTDEPTHDRSHSRATGTGPTVSEFQPKIDPNVFDGPDPAGEQKDPADNPFANEGLRDAPPHVKQQGAEFLADKILLGYGKVKMDLAEWLICISEKKIDKLERSGQVNRKIPIPLREGGTIPAWQAIRQHNKETEKIIADHALTQQFYDEAHPMLTEELAKRDVALTNLQMLGATTLMDLYKFGKALKPMWEQRNDLINAFKAATEAYNRAGGYAAQTVATGPAPTPTPESEQAAPQPEPQQQPPPPRPSSQADAMFENIQNEHIARPAPVTDTAPMPASTQAVKPSSITMPGKRGRGTQKGEKRGPYKKKNKK